MKKVLMSAVICSALGLAGCVAVPVNEGYGGYAPAPPVYVAPPAIAPVVVVRPWFYGYYAGGRGGHRYH